jgi:hypothetical protein
MSSLSPVAGRFRLDSNALPRGGDRKNFFVIGGSLSREENKLL